MGQPENGKMEKENITLTIGKKKNAKKSKRATHRRNNRVGMENLECINDALRFHQAYRHHETWKLVPKDSCDVYRDRKRREKENGKEKSSGKGNGKRTAPGRRGTVRKIPSSSSECDRSMSDDDDSRYSRENPKALKRPKKTTKRKCQKKRAKR